MRPPRYQRRSSSHFLVSIQFRSDSRHHIRHRVIYARPQAPQPHRLQLGITTALTSVPLAPSRYIRPCTRDTAGGPSRCFGTEGIVSS